MEMSVWCLSNNKMKAVANRFYLEVPDALRNIRNNVCPAEHPKQCATDFLKFPSPAERPEQHVFIIIYACGCSLIRLKPVNQN